MAYLYLAYEDRPPLEHLLGSVAKQLLDSTKLPPSLKRIWNRQRHIFDRNSPSQQHPSLEEVHEILADVTRDRQVYIIVDALDECVPELRVNLVNHLQKISKDINLLVTSRMFEGFDRMAEGFSQIPVAARSDDIQRYIDYVIEKRGGLQDTIKEDPNLRKYIGESVTQKSSQM